MKKIIKSENKNRGEIIIYKTPQGPRLDIKLDKETVWLTQKQIANLFGSERSVITKHLKSIFQSKELKENSVCAIFAHTAEDGKTYKTKFYNLDIIISVGYRINSVRATQFRIWATKTLKEHLVRGYTINEQRLLTAKDKFTELQNAISFLQKQANSLTMFI